MLVSGSAVERRGNTATTHLVGILKILLRMANPGYILHYTLSSCAKPYFLVRKDKGHLAFNAARRLGKTALRAASTPRVGVCVRASPAAMC